MSRFREEMRALLQGAPDVFQAPSGGVAFVRREREFDRCAGDVPGEILASDQVVGGVMIQGVGLDQLP